MKLEWEQQNWACLTAKGQDCRRYEIFPVNPLSEINSDIILQQHAIGSVRREMRFHGCQIEAAKARAQAWENWN